MKKATVNFLSSMVIFGTIGLFVDAIPLNSGVIALFRGIMGLVFLLLVMALTKQKLRFDVIKKELLLLCISGGAMGLNWVLLFEAYRYTTVATATVCYYLAPAFLMLASPLLGEKLTVKKLLCLFTCLVGMVLVTGIDGGSVTGVAFGIGAAILYASVMFINRKIKSVSDYERTVTQMAMSIPVVAAYVLLRGGVDFSAMNATGWLLMAVVGIVHTGFAYFLYFGAVGKLPATSVAVCSYLDPVVAVLLSAILIAPIGIPAVSGAVLILGSTLFGQLKE
jgi:RarD protein